jgi:hypothetical protein
LNNFMPQFNLLLEFEGRGGETRPPPKSSPARGRSSNEAEQQPLRRSTRNRGKTDSPAPKDDVPPSSGETAPSSTSASPADQNVETGVKDSTSHVTDLGRRLQTSLEDSVTNVFPSSLWSPSPRKKKVVRAHVRSGGLPESLGLSEDSSDEESPVVAAGEKQNAEVAVGNLKKVGLPLKYGRFRASTQRQYSLTITSCEPNSEPERQIFPIAGFGEARMLRSPLFMCHRSEK